MESSATIKSLTAPSISFLTALEALLWRFWVPEDTGGASAMLEKENVTGFTVPSKIQQYGFEIAWLIPVNLHSNIWGMVKRGQILYGYTITGICCLALRH